MQVFALVISLFILALLVGVPVLLVMVARLSSRMQGLEASSANVQVRLAAVEAQVNRGAGGTASQPAAPGPDLPRPIKTGAGVEPEAEFERPPAPLHKSQSPIDSGSDQQGSVVAAAGGRPSTVPPVPPSSPAGPPSAPPRSPVGSGAAQPPSESFEQQLGTRWAVYVGGAALALGGIFLVKHAIDAGLLTPAMRVALGFALGCALVAAGTWMNVRERAEADGEASAIGGLPAQAHIPSVLTAAGTIVLFGSGYAAHALYGLIGSGPAFVLLGAIGIATMLSAALHGPGLAGLGLAASYVTPLLVSSQAPSPWPLIVYLAVVAIAALALARLRGWVWLLAAAIAGAVVWGFVILGQGGVNAEVWYTAAMIHTALQTALAAGVLGLAAQPSANSRGVQDAVPDQIDWTATIALAALAVLAIAVLAAVPVDSQFAAWTTFAAVMVAVLLALAVWCLPLSAAAVLAGVVVLAALVLWPGLSEPPTGSVRWPGVDNLMRLPDVIYQFAVFACVACGACVAAAWLRLGEAQVPAVERSAVYALAATATPLLALVVAYLRITQFGTAISFSVLGILLAGAFAWSAQVFERREIGTSALAARIPTGAFAAAAIAALSLALVAGLQRGYLTVAFALAALGTAYVANRKDIAVLRPAAGALGLLVLARVVWDPRIMGADLGTLPIFNWLLVGYGVPAVAFWLAADLLRRRADDGASRLMEGLAVLFAALLVFWQLRHWLHGGDPLVASSGHVEAGLMALMSLGFTHVMQRLGAARASAVFQYASYAFAVISGLIIVLSLGIAHNPLLHGAERVVGGVPLSSLVPAYLLPGLMALYIARHGRDGWPAEIISILGGVAMALIFAYVTLEVRHAFQGEDLQLWRHTSSPEMWAFTLAWLVLAIAFLGYGLLRGSLPARAASGLLLALTVAKVGLVDLADVEGIWRALSFICLGAVLIGIGLVYQRLVFAQPRNGVRPPLRP